MANRFAIRCRARRNFRAGILPNIGQANTCASILNNDFGAASYGGIGYNFTRCSIATAQIFNNVIGEGVTFHVQLPYTNSFAWFLGSNTYVNTTSTNVPLFADPASSEIHIYQ